MIASVIGVTLGEPSFLIYMGLFDLKTEALTSNANQLIGATSGVFQVCMQISVISWTDLFKAGAFFGVLIASYVMDKW